MQKRSLQEDGIRSDDYGNLGQIISLIRILTIVEISQNQVNKNHGSKISLQTWVWMIIIIFLPPNECVGIWLPFLPSFDFGPRCSV